MIFEKDPDLQLISQNYADTFNEMVESTSAHKKCYKPNESIREDKSSKLRDFVEISGKGLPPYMVTSNAPIDYVHWDDPNELVDPLTLLMVERQAGNPYHVNEIQSIIEELREAQIKY